MKTFEIKQVHNGYIVTIEGAIKGSGIRVFKNTEEHIMLEFIGEIVLDKKVSVKDR